MFEVGDIIFYYNHWSDLVHEAIIMGIQENARNQLVYHLADLTNGADCGCLVEDAYLTKEACLMAIQEKSQKQIAEYIEQIQNMEDLIRFLLEHQTSGESADLEARVAAVKKAEEFCGVLGLKNRRINMFNIGDNIYYENQGIICSAEILNIQKKQNGEPEYYLIRDTKTLKRYFVEHVYLTEKDYLIT